MRKMLISIFCLLVLVSCEPEPLSIEIPQAETKLVVYTQNLPDQALIVSLSKSFAALTLPNQSSDSTQNDSLNAIFIRQFLVDSAIVTVNGPDFNDTLVRATTGFYIAPFFPFTPGNTYRLEAYDPTTNLTITSTTTTLPTATLEQFEAIRREGDDSARVDFNYKINDLPGDNYYLLNIYTDSIPTSDFFGLNDESNARTFIFSDREFEPNNVSGDNFFFDETLSENLVVTLTNISRDYYDFLVARNRAGNSFLSEPVSFPSNVEGGYGYFNLHFPSAQVVEVK